MILINETLEGYAKEGRQLYHDLYLIAYCLNNEKDAHNYLRYSARYNFISQMFNDMQIYHWRDEAKLLEELEK